MDKSRLSHYLKVVAFGILAGMFAINGVCQATPKSEMEEQERVEQRNREAKQPTQSQTEEDQRVAKRKEEAEDPGREEREAERTQQRLEEADGN